MSKLNPGLYTSEDHTWQTPPDLIDTLLHFERITEFDLDPCCTDKNIPARHHYQSHISNGLSLPWEGLAFMNPPYGNVLKAWMQKALEESQKPNCQVWALIPARTDTIYQHDFGITRAGFTVFMKSRLEFWKDGKPYLVMDKKSGKMKPGTAPFPTMLLYYGMDWKQKAFRWLKEQPIEGTLMFPG
ncbi:MAG TPA: DNA N-6-adenine-methyltransferase [Bdellovibrio sp.]|nr:DNA N-6-adenine-methyltransferase [Bdellovibrio sp.]